MLVCQPCFKFTFVHKLNIVGLTSAHTTKTHTQTDACIACIAKSPCNRNCEQSEGLQLIREPFSYSFTQAPTLALTLISNGCVVVWPNKHWMGGCLQNRCVRLSTHCSHRRVKCPLQPGRSFAAIAIAISSHLEAVIHTWIVYQTYTFTLQNMRGGRGHQPTIQSAIQQRL